MTHIKLFDSSLCDERGRKVFDNDGLFLLLPYSRLQKLTCKFVLVYG